MDRPLGRKTYGSIGHLPGSHANNPGDHYITDGQARIATKRARDKNDVVIVQEKLDGSCVGVALQDGVIIPLGRAGYPAVSSPYYQHTLFHNWVRINEERFRAVLQEGERIVGEWLAQAHGTRYDLGNRSPFVPFDIMTGTQRVPWGRFIVRLRDGEFKPPPTISLGRPCSIERAFEILGEHGKYGAADKAEGCVWRVERSGKIDYLCKFVRADYPTGRYLFDKPIWNWQP